MTGRTVVAAVSVAALCTGLLPGASAAAASHPGARPAAASGGTWGKAQEVPGLRALNNGGSAQLSSVSCASAGNCSAGGDYADASVHGQAFIVSEVNGTWGTAQEVPGSGTLNNAGFAGISSVSCPSAANCGAGGYYTYRAPGHTHNQSAFVVSETKG